ncbi:MAG: energy transducer TonB [Caulobacter sp.]|nr:energy transducer TonB [Caulobacter sp.]
MSRLLYEPRSSGRRIAPDTYPREALDLTVSGEVVVVCRFARRKLEVCRADQEVPEGMGFGRVAVQQVEAQWKTIPRRVSGTVTGDEIRFSYSVAAPIAGPAAVTEAPWAQVPSGEALRMAWPKALANTRRGSAALRCRVEADGSLSNCRVAGEVPWQSDLGRAALTLAPAYRVDMGAAGGDLVGSDIIVSIRLTNPADPTAHLR